MIRRGVKATLNYISLQYGTELGTLRLNPCLNPVCRVSDYIQGGLGDKTFGQRIVTSFL